MSFKIKKTAAAVIALGLGHAGLAVSQTSADVTPNKPASATARERLESVQVTGNPQASAELIQAQKVLSGDALVLTRAATLGETLEKLPGVAGSYFGPNSNRPSLRGLDGDRVRMLNNASASLDASSLSYDHAVPIDPLVIERIEVLHGAAALLYGGSAVGGAVNMQDNRIPRAQQSGITGAGELRLGGASAERNGAVVLDGGAGDWAWHLDGAARDSKDLRVPHFNLPEGGQATRVQNSDAKGHSFAAGSSVFFKGGFVGASVDDYHNDYGVTVEPDIRIRMQRQRLALAGEWTLADSFVRRIQWQTSHARYEHAEIEGSGEVGTLFTNRGEDLRLEFEHAPLAGLRGVVGAQWESSHFKVTGEEAMVPTSRTRSAAAFVLEKWQSGPLTVTAGLRAENVLVRSDGDVADAAEPHFGAASSRRFKPVSMALSSEWNVSPQWALRADLSRSQRAPSFFELHANGVHVASGAYERGDVSLGLETAHAAELGLTWTPQAGTQLRASVHETRFRNFIALNATGVTIEVEPGHGHEGEEHADEHVLMPEYRFEAVPATLRGWELELKTALPWKGWALSGQIDSVRGFDRRRGEPLPRIAPQRLKLQVDAQWQDWAASLSYSRHASQPRVPSVDTATGGHGQWRLMVNRHLDWTGVHALWYFKLDNVANTLAYSATSMATVRHLSPLPGRSVHTGLQIRF